MPHTSKIRVRPDNPDVVWVAGLGNAFAQHVFMELAGPRDEWQAKIDHLNNNEVLALNTAIRQAGLPFVGISDKA